MTRKDRVLRDLTVAGPRGFCAFTWYVQARPNDRNAPSELNGVRGCVIRSETCHERDHPDGQTYARHFLVYKPVRTEEPSAHRGGGADGSSVRTGLRHEEAVAASKAGPSTAQPPVADQLALIR